MAICYCVSCVTPFRKLCKEPALLGFERRIMKASLIILSAILFAACSKSTSNPISSSNVSFKNDVQPIFTANCALSGCHATASPSAGNQNLSTGQAFNNIVNVASYEIPTYLRVKPSNSDSSYLYMKITGASGISGARMPYGKAPLSSTDIQTIKDWIDEGAQNN